MPSDREPGANLGQRAGIGCETRCPFEIVVEAGRDQLVEPERSEMHFAWDRRRKHDSVGIYATQGGFPPQVRNRHRQVEKNSRTFSIQDFERGLWRSACFWLMASNSRRSSRWRSVRLIGVSMTTWQ